MIACVSLPYFAATLACQDDPTLAGTPLVFGGMPWQGGDVLAVSPEAARAGVRPGLPLRQAHVLCPQARFLPLDLVRGEGIAEQIVAALARFSAYIEHLSPPSQRLEVFLDLRRLQVADARTPAHDLARAVHSHLATAPRIGLATGRFTAQIAARRARPDQPETIAPGAEARFLQPFPVRWLPLNSETLRQLALLGLPTIGHFAALPAGAVLNRFGRAGRLAHRLAQGRDDQPVARFEPRQVMTASRLLDAPLADRLTLTRVLEQLAAQTAAQLSAEGLAARQVSLAVAQDDRARHKVRITLRAPSSSARHLAATLDELLAALPLTGGLTELHVTLDGLGPALPQQLSLFDLPDSPRDRLERAVQHLAARYSQTRFAWPALHNAAALLPERRFCYIPAGRS